MDILFSLEKDLDLSQSTKSIMYANNIEDIILEKPVAGVGANFYNEIVGLKIAFSIVQISNDLNL